MEVIPDLTKLWDCSLIRPRENSIGSLAGISGEDIPLDFLLLRDPRGTKKVPQKPLIADPAG
jgi:hypothetical protein